jgi:hypothetical protein
MTDREDRFATFEEVQAAFDGVRLSVARSYRAALEFLYHGHPDDEPRPVYLEDGVLRVQIPLKHMESADEHIGRILAEVLAELTKTSQALEIVFVPRLTTK